MPTPRQATGEKAENAVVRFARCPRCTCPRQMRRWKGSFPAVDIICPRCGFLAQVKAAKRTPSGQLIAGSGGNWGVQLEKMLLGVYYDLYVVVLNGRSVEEILRVPAHMLQATPSVFQPKTPIRSGRNRGLQQFTYNLAPLPQYAFEEIYSRPRRRRRRKRVHA